jgi:hypothetical protein
MKRFLMGFVAATSAASVVIAQTAPVSVAPTEYIYNTTTNSTSNNTNTNNNTSASTSTNNNNNTSTSTSTNTNLNQNVNSGTMTNINQNTSTNTNVNQNINSGTMTNINQNTSASTSDNTNRNINTDTSNSTINQSVNSTSSNTNRNINSDTINSTASTSNVNQNNNVNVSDSKSYSESVNRQVIDQNIKSPPPSAIAPSMMSYSQDLCTTGQSGAVQTQIIGLSAGRTVRDQNCERMKLSKTLYDMGMRVAAVSLLCQDTRVFKAMEMAGTPCPFMGAIGEAATAAWEENADRRPDAD